MLEYLRHYGIPFVAALTKADKLKKSQQQAAAGRFAEICGEYGCRGVYVTSAENGCGIETLRGVLGRGRAGERGLSDGVRGVCGRV